MSQFLLEGPSQEPVSIADAKHWLRVEHAQDNDLIGALIVSARMLVEQTTRVLLLSQRWRITCVAALAGDGIELPLAPILSVDQVRLQPLAGASFTLDAASWRLDRAGDVARLELLSLTAATFDARIEIDVTAGFGSSAADVPSPLIQAVRMLVARWYDHRGDASIVREAAVAPHDVMALLAPYRRMRL